MTTTYAAKPRSLSHLVGEKHENRTLSSLEIRDHYVIDLRIEKLLTRPDLNMARDVGVTFPGGDFLAVKNGVARLIECKTSIRPVGLTGQNTFRVGKDDVYALIAKRRDMHVWPCIVLGDMQVVTPEEVEQHGRLVDGEYYLIHSSYGRDFSEVFGYVEGMGIEALAA